jgi:4'-phosphopantetheinyl transferase
MSVFWLEQTEVDVPPQPEWLSANEAIRLSSMRFAKRRADWQLGRWTAKRALVAYLKLPAQPHILANIEIRAAPSGAPEIFFGCRRAAVRISLSHRAGRGMCAIAPVDTALGCDLELIEPRSDAFVADYFSAEEQALVERSTAAARPGLLALLWSAKESVLKLLRTGLRLDTRCVTVSFLDTPQLSREEEEQSLEDTTFSVPLPFGRSRWHALRVGNSNGEIFHGWWQRSGDLLRTLVAAPAPDPPILLNLSPKEWPAQKEANHETTIHSAA